MNADLDLWLVRHGATAWSEASRINGWTDVPLSDIGRVQARDLAASLDASDFMGVWCSDLRRAADTARLAVGAASPDARLRELDFGELEGKTWDECPPPLQRAMVDFDRFAAPGGESVHQLRARVLEFIATLPRGAHLVFTHGGVIRLLRQIADQDGDAKSAGSASNARPRIDPGEVVRITSYRRN